MTAPALPPEVEVAIQRVAQTCWLDGKQGAESKEAHGYLDALRTAIARAVGGDGEPVAWGVGSRVVVIGKALNEGHNFVGRTGVVVEPIDHAKARWVRFDGDDNKTSVPMRYLAVAPAATGDTGEGEKARAEISAALARLTDDERAVLPLNVQEDARPRVRLAHIEAGEGAPAGQGTAVVSVPAKYARLAWAMVCAINAAIRARGAKP